MLTSLDALDASFEASAEETTHSILKVRRFEHELAEPDFSPSVTQIFYLSVRRLLDFTLALMLTAAAIPIVVLAAVAVRVTSRGPAFYTQTRSGKNGKSFTIYKIRSMVHQCESLTGPRWTIPDDPRVTAIGWVLRRTHIDELPQLLNVLKGEMSLIGPRPERPEFVNELKQVIPDYENRHLVLPGITGLAQVQLAPDSDIRTVVRKLRYDLHYIEHMSMGLDLRILLATGLHMLGVSFHALQCLRIVPGPAQVETPTTITLPIESSRRRQAA